MNRRAFVFTFEALLTLIAAVTLVLLSVPPSGETSANAQLQREALAQDLLETATKEKTLANTLYAFAAGSGAAKQEIEGDWTNLLSNTSVACFKFDAGSGALETECHGQKKFSATASRVLFGGGRLARFSEAKLTLYFDS
ncbi:MAG: hypothetical protein V1817_04965 [Candidatus Micrarchaeota archaeon]